jgi:tetratricopeptide (TPR) repeat protein
VPSPYNNRGCIRRYLKDHAGSLEDHTRAIELNPRSHEAYANRGLTHWELKDYAAAIADTEKALEIAPRDWAFRERVEEDLASMRRDRER